MNKFMRYILRFILFVFIVFLGYKTYNNSRGIKYWLNARKERVKLSLQKEAISSDKQRLQQELFALKNDPHYLEGEVRKNIKKGYKGEIFYTFQDDRLLLTDDKHIKK